jgi:uncharacterized protein with PIN domain
MKFITDSMLGSLTRWLRLIGYDVLYLKDFDDAELIEEARKKNRILLTSDLELYKQTKKQSIKSLLIKEKEKAGMLAQVVSQYNLSLDVNPAKSRCPKCGKSLNPISKEKIKNKIPPSTLKFYDYFWICSNKKCCKIYWYGSHWKKINIVLNRAKEIKIGLNTND